MSIETKTITQFVGQFYQSDLSESVIYKTLRDSLSEGQLFSKLRIVQIMQELNIRSKRCIFLAHWHGFLPLLLKNYNLVDAGVGVELDERWVNFSNRMNYFWDWKGKLGDVLNFHDYNDYDLIINTSCEHMDSSWLKNVPHKSTLILQSTDYRHEEHVNRVDSIDEFISQLPSHLQVIQSDVLQCPIYKRFTLVVGGE